MDKCQGDILLSSAGWAGITSRANLIRLRAWTPNQIGLRMREPALVPHAFEMRGKRIPGTNEYKTILPATIEESVYFRGRKVLKSYPSKRSNSRKEDTEYVEYRKKIHINFNLA